MEEGFVDVEWREARRRYFEALILNNESNETYSNDFGAAPWCKHFESKYATYSALTQ